MKKFIKKIINATIIAFMIGIGVGSHQCNATTVLFGTVTHGVAVWNPSLMRDIQIEGGSVTTTNGSLTLTAIIYTTDNDRLSIDRIPTDYSGGTVTTWEKIKFLMLSPVGTVTPSEERGNVFHLSFRDDPEGSYTVLCVATLVLKDGLGKPYIMVSPGTYSCTGGKQIFLVKPRVTRIEIIPATATFTVGNGGVFQLRAWNQFGELIPDVAGTWTVTPALGFVMPTVGTYTVFTAGTKTMTGSISVSVGGTLSATARIELFPGTPTAIALVPATSTLSVGGAQEISAVVMDTFGNAAELHVKKWSWDCDKGTITGTGTVAVFQATEPGTVTIVLGVETLQNTTIVASTTVVVRELGTLTFIVVMPSAATITIGGTITLTAQGYDQYGSPIPGLTYAWSIDPGDSGTIVVVGSSTNAAAAIFTAGTKSQNVKIIAEVGGVRGTSTIVIVGGPMVRVKLEGLPNVIPETLGTTTESYYPGTITVFFSDEYGNPAIGKTGQFVYILVNNSQGKNIGYLTGLEENGRLRKPSIEGISCLEISPGTFKIESYLLKVPYTEVYYSVYLGQE